MAHRKAGGTAKSLRDSNPKYLGVKIADGQAVESGNVIIRQRGTKILPGANVSVGTDHTIYARKNGTVRFSKIRKTGYDSKVKRRTKVSVV